MTGTCERRLSPWQSAVHPIDLNLKRTQLMDEETQVCRVCGIEKPLSEFYKNSTYKNGYVSTCKSCMKRQRQTHFKLDSFARERRRASQALYYEKHFEERREAQRLYAKKRYAKI